MLIIKTKGGRENVDCVMTSPSTKVLNLWYLLITLLLSYSRVYAEITEVSYFRRFLNEISSYLIHSCT